MKKYILLFIVFVPFFLQAQNHKIQGLIVDSINQIPVDYANIGIEGKNLGTVSNDSGYFKLEIPDKFLNDSLTFSRIGYVAKKIGVGELVQQGDPEVNLVSKSTEIAEAKIISAKLKRVKRGNKVRKSIIWFPFYADTASLGLEIGTVIRLPNKSVVLKDFNFFISFVSADSVKLRLNIYDYNKGIVGDNLLNSNIYFVLHHGDRKDYCIDLSDLNLVANGDIFVAIENVAGYKSNSQLTQKNQNKNDKQFTGTMLFSATFTGSKGLRRKVSLGNWEEIQMGVSPGFWVTILK